MAIVDGWSGPRTRSEMVRARSKRGRRRPAGTPPAGRSPPSPQRMAATLVSGSATVVHFQRRRCAYTLEVLLAHQPGHPLARSNSPYGPQTGREGGTLFEQADRSERLRRNAPANSGWAGSHTRVRPAHSSGRRRSSYRRVASNGQVLGITVSLLGARGAVSS
jgi:hypothetical protein